MKTYVIVRDTGDRDTDVEFWGRIGGIHGVEMWVEDFPSAMVYFSLEQAEAKADGLRITCCVVVDYGLETQDIANSYYEEKEEVGHHRQAACAEVAKAMKISKELREMSERQAEAIKKAETKEDSKLGIHSCEICYTRGVGENDLNLICDECQKALPSLLKSVGELEPLRELFQCYQDTRENSAATGDTEWWLKKFVEVTGTLLE